MSKVSILIPSRAEKPENLRRTVQSIYDNATGDFEVLVGFDDFKDGDDRSIFDYILDGSIETKFKNLKVIRFPGIVGIKTNINALAALATGEYIYKSDAHCAFGKGFDEILQADMQEDWIVMPRFKIIKEEDWSIQTRDGREEFYDYFYLCCPFTDPKGFRFKAGGHWSERTKEREESDFDLREEDLFGYGTHIDETPQIHGSGWFMTKDRFFELGGFPNIDPYGHAQEPIWLALKNWLMGGKVMVNKKTWYAHMHQQGNKRGYQMDKEQENKSYRIAAEHFVGDKGNYLHSFEWFVDKFSPMPTWPDNWRELLDKYQEENNG